MQVKMTSSAKPLRGFTLTVLCPGFTDRTSPRFESWVYHITKWRAAHLLGVSDSRKSPTFFDDVVFYLPNRVFLKEKAVIQKIKYHK